MFKHKLACISVNSNGGRNVHQVLAAALKLPCHAHIALPSLTEAVQSMM